MSQADPVVCPFWLYRVDPKSNCAKQDDLAEGISNIAGWNCSHAHIVQMGQQIIIRCPLLTIDECDFMRKFLEVFRGMLVKLPDPVPAAQTTIEPVVVPPAGPPPIPTPPPMPTVPSPPASPTVSEPPIVEVIYPESSGPATENPPKPGDHHDS